MLYICNVGKLKGELTSLHIRNKSKVKHAVSLTGDEASMGGIKYNFPWLVLEVTYLVYNYAHKCICTEDVYVLLPVIL